MAFSWIEDKQLTVSLFGELQRTLVQGTSADTAEAGRIRTIPVAIGSMGGSIYDARFVPMPPGQALDAGVQDLIDWIREGADVERNPVVSAAMAHYQFETLHPFNDGNGRLGRLLIVLQLVLDGALSEPLLSVSPWFEARRDAYQGALAEVSATGSWDGWVQFFALGIEASAIDTAARMGALLEVQSQYQETIRVNGGKGVVRDITDILIGDPYVTIRSLANRTGKTYQAVSNAVGKLVEYGILSELASSPTRRIFRAPDVLRVTTRS
jgi:Fic family protein